MEISNLLKPKSTPPPPEVFLAVQIQEGLVKTALWQIAADQPEVLAFGSTQNYTDPESLPLAVDTSLTHALSYVDSDPNRVLFGLPETWIKDNQLSPEVKDMIASITKQLELKPVGFVSITDALITHLKNKEGIPPSVMLIEIGDTKVNVVVTRLGKVLGREEVDRSDDIAADVAEGIARIDTDQLPSRFLVINGNDPELEQQLVSYPWMEKFPFLHIPKVEVPDPHFSIEAIAISGGGEAARSLGYEIVETPTPETETESEENDQPTEEGLPAQPAQLAAGFVVDADIQNVQPTTESPPIITPTPKPNIKDLRSKISIPSFHLPRFKLPKFPHTTNLTAKKSKKLLIIVPVILLALLTGIYSLFLFVLNAADIQVQVDPYILSKSVAIAISDKPSSLPTLNATPQTFDIEKTDSLATTGEAIVGEKAKGQVAIFNKTDTPKTFPKGTLLTSDNGLKFFTDAEVTVASKSASSNIDLNTGTQTINLGHETVTVTAAKIGTESNLSSNTTLTVATYPLSSFEAKVNSELTGGTSRTVRAVATADQKQLLDNVMEQVKKDAADKVASTGDQEAVPTSDIKINKQTFTKGVGEEAEALSLTIQATITVLKYKPEELQKLVADQLSSQIPAGYEFDPLHFDVTVKDTTTSSNGDVTANAVIEAKLMPKLDIDQYRKQIAGKSVSSARQLFESITGYRAVSFKIKYHLPFSADRLPYNPSKISIAVVPVQ